MIRFKKSNTNNKDKWIKEIFINTSTKIGGFLNLNFDFRKIRLLYLLLIVGFAILLAKTGYLQLVKGKYYYNLSRINKVRTFPIKPNRGIIYDDKGNILVKNNPIFSLYALSDDLHLGTPETEKILTKISEITKKSKKELKEKIKNNSGAKPFKLINKLTYDQAIKIKIANFNTSGITVRTSSYRDYKSNCSSYSHILGYIGKINPEEYKKLDPKIYSLTDNVGKSGLEYVYDKILRGINGKKTILVDATGRIIKELSIQKPKDGLSLKLSINSGLQKKAEEELSKAIKKAKAHSGCVVILNPQNGEVMALVSLPSYNNNDFAQGIDKKKYNDYINNPYRPLFDRSISGEYPPGSTFKPIVAAAALEQEIINENTSFLSTGGIRLGKWFFPDWKRGGHGITAVRRAIAESINTFFYYIGGGYDKFKGLGEEKIIDYAKLFGLGETTNIDLPWEAKGFLPTKKWKERTKNEAWYIGDTYHLSIGQGDILVTPLQISTYIAFFANGGILYQPHIVRSFVNDKCETVKKQKIKVIRKNFISKKNIKIVRQGMRQAVLSGSARRLKSLPIKVAGKTGTAQWSSKKGNKPHAWFTCFAPYNNPKIVITVLVEKAGEGNEIALPVAQKILEWWISKNPKLIKKPV